GSALVAMGAGSEGRAWDTASWQCTWSGHLGSASILDCALSPDGKMVGTTDERGMLGLWRVLAKPIPGRAPLAPIAALPGHRGPSFGIDFSPDSRQVATGGLDLAIRIWDVASRKKIATLA